IRIYPTVSNGHIIIELSDYIDYDLYIEVYDIIGQLVYKKTITNVKDKNEIDISMFAADMYIIKAGFNTKLKQEKLIIYR
ncbi:MAG: T9SS type A sorting domain-containing protein, partial [Chlorobi bacterium]|nr:T9SS type A sorting domain-containing protein [Chlorobiota bacterium]